LLSDPRVGVVYISTTNELHCDQVLAAAAAGKHVFCEKPLALSLEDARSMVRACLDAGVQMATNHHLRNADAHQAMRDLVRDGVLGRVLYARIFHAIYLRPKVQGWRINRPDAGGVPILDIAVHDVDALRFNLGSEPVEAIGMAQSATLAERGLEDDVMAALKMDDDTLVQIHAAFTVPYAGAGLEIHGDKGSIIARGVMTVQQDGEVLLRDAEGERAVPFSKTDLYGDGVARFVSAILGSGSPSASGEDGVRSLAGALAISEACRRETRVEVPT
jgi:1,5-anhydro-D-fructose reductase (1,5-anhydro-D-mannitol-forming)